jgi:hypothetical protein
MMYYQRRIENGVPQPGEYISANAIAGPIHVYEAHGGWIASVVDLAKFGSAFDVPRRCRVLSPRAIEAMFARPIGHLGLDEAGQPKRKFYGFGWFVSYGSEGPTIYHAGNLRNSTGALYRRPDGLNFAFVLNVPKTEGDTPFSAALHKTADKLRGGRF